MLLYKGNKCHFGYELCMTLDLYLRYNLLYTRSLNQEFCVFKQDYKYADTHKTFFFRFPSKSLSNCLKGNIVIKIRKSLCIFNVCQLNVELPIKPNLSSAHFRFYRVNRK